MGENAKDISDSSFEAEVLKSNIPVLVDFWAPWCAPCKSIAPAVEELAVEYDGDPLSVGFNARYLLDFIASIGEARHISLELHGELGPGKLSIPNDESYLGIVMPMRLT